MFSIHSTRHLQKTKHYANETLRSKDLDLTWDIRLTLALWKLFCRKKYVVCLLLYIRGKYNKVDEPIIIINGMTTHQLESKLRMNNWTWRKY